MYLGALPLSICCVDEIKTGTGNGIECVLNGERRNERLCGHLKVCGSLEPYFSTLTSTEESLCSALSNIFNLDLELDLCQHAISAVDFYTMANCWLLRWPAECPAASG